MVANLEKNKKNFDSNDFSRTRWFSYTSSTETTRSWPKLMKSYEDLPRPFKESGYFNTEKIPYTILIPQSFVVFPNKIIKTNPKLILLYDNNVTVLEQKRSKIDSKCHYLNDIYYIKRRSILLSANIAIISSAGASSLSFNAVCDELFKPIINTVRKFYNKLDTGPDNDESLNENHEKELLKIERLDDITCKFINYGINSIIHGQNIKDVIYQKTINLRSIKKGIFKWINNFTSPLLLIKTDNELIIIEEPVKIRNAKKKEYGGLYTYIPLGKIDKINIYKDIFRKMEIKLINGVSFNLFFSEDKNLNKYNF